MNYLAENMIIENGLTSLDLRMIAAGGEIPSGFRSLIMEYHKATEYYRNKARAMIDSMPTYLEPRYLASLEIIYSLYQQIFERIDVREGIFSTAELNPSPEEVHDRIKLTIESFELSF
jgi:hypothetical protein